MNVSLEYRETCLKIISDKKIDALPCLIKLYDELDSYITKDSLFLTSYTPVEIVDDAPRIVKSMANASAIAGVGPMAAVAGAFAEAVGEYLLQKGAKDVVVENGGDIYLKTSKEKTVGLHAGPSPFSNKLGFRIKPGETPLGVCTSSASVGHSISLGKSDAVTVFSKSTPLADAAATAIGNEVRENDVKKALKKGKKIRGINGFVIAAGDRLALWGRIPEIVQTDFDVDGDYITSKPN